MLRTEERRKRYVGILEQPVGGMHKRASTDAGLQTSPTRRPATR